MGFQYGVELRNAGMGFCDGMDSLVPPMRNTELQPIVKTWVFYCIETNTLLQWLVTLPLEIVAASITVDYWHPNVSNAAWVAIFWTLIVLINLFGVKGYGEAEFAFSLIKVIAVVGFM